MNKVWKIARHTYAKRVRKVARLAVILLGIANGLLFLGLLGVFVVVGAWLTRTGGAIPDTENAPIGVLDQSGRAVPIPRAFSDRFSALASEKEATRALVAGEVRFVLVRPEEPLDSGRATIWRVSGSSYDTRAEEEVKAFLIAWSLEGKVDEDIVSRVIAPLAPEVVHLDANGRPRSQMEVFAGVTGLVLSALLIGLMHLSHLTLLGNLEEEQQGHVLEMLLSAVSPAQLLAGKAIGLLGFWLTGIGIGCVALVVLSESFAALLREWFALRPQWFLFGGIYFLAGWILFALPGAALATLVRSSVERGLVVSLFLAVIVTPYVLVLVPEHPSVDVVRVSSVFPLTAPGVMLIRLARGPVPAVDVVASLMVLLVTVPLAFLFAVRLFRTGLLLYGKPPGLRHLLRAFGQA